MWLQELAFAAAQLLGHGVSAVTLAGVAIPLSSPRAHINRVSLLLTNGGSWLELGTDCASGITALQQGSRVFGGIILATSCIEFLVVAAHTSSAQLAAPMLCFAMLHSTAQQRISLSIGTCMAQQALTLAAGVPLA